MLFVDGRHDEALPALRRASDLGERLADDNPKNNTYVDDLINYRFREANVLARLGRRDEAEASLVKARSRREAWLKAEPVATTKLAIGKLAGTVESIFSRPGDRATVEEWRGRACGLLDEVLRDDPRNKAARDDLASLLQRQGETREEEGRDALAVGSFERATELLEGLAREDPKELYSRRYFDAAFHRAATLERLGRDAEAIAAFEAVVPVTDALLTRQVTRSRVYRRLEEDASIAFLGWKTGRTPPADAVARLTSALARVAKTPFETPEVLASTARCHALRARFAEVPGSGRAAEDGRLDIREAAGLLQRAVAAGLPVAEVLKDRVFAPLLVSPEAPLLREDLTMPALPFASP